MHNCVHMCVFKVIEQHLSHIWFWMPDMYQNNHVPPTKRIFHFRLFITNSKRLDSPNVEVYCCWATKLKVISHQFIPFRIQVSLPGSISLWAYSSIDDQLQSTIHVTIHHQPAIYQISITKNHPPSISQPTVKQPLTSIEPSIEPTIEPTIHQPLRNHWVCHGAQRCRLQGLPCAPHTWPGKELWPWWASLASPGSHVWCITSRILVLYLSIGVVKSP